MKPGDPTVAEVPLALPWYVYDRHANLLHIADTLAAAEAWSHTHWNVASVAEREEVAANDYFYLLLAYPSESGFVSRDYQVRIMRRDRVETIGRDPLATPRPGVGFDRGRGTSGR